MHVYIYLHMYISHNRWYVSSRTLIVAVTQANDFMELAGDERTATRANQIKLYQDNITFANEPRMAVFQTAHLNISEVVQDKRVLLQDSVSRRQETSRTALDSQTSPSKFHTRM